MDHLQNSHFSSLGYLYPYFPQRSTSAFCNEPRGSYLQSQGSCHCPGNKRRKYCNQNIHMYSPIRLPDLDIKRSIISNLNSIHYPACPSERLQIFIICLQGTSESLPVLLRVPRSLHGRFLRSVSRSLPYRG